MTINPNKFIEEYKAICEKRGFIIHACGCCESPWIVEIGMHHDLKEHLEHLLEQWNK